MSVHKVASFELDQISQIQNNEKQSISIQNIVKTCLSSSLNSSEGEELAQRIMNIASGMMEEYRRASTYINASFIFAKIGRLEKAVEIANRFSVQFGPFGFGPIFTIFATVGKTRDALEEIEKMKQREHQDLALDGLVRGLVENPRRVSKAERIVHKIANLCTRDASWISICLAYIKHANNIGTACSKIEEHISSQEMRDSAFQHICYEITKRIEYSRAVELVKNIKDPELRQYTIDEMARIYLNVHFNS